MVIGVHKMTIQNNDGNQLNVDFTPLDKKQFRIFRPPTIAIEPQADHEDLVIDPTPKARSIGRSSNISNRMKGFRETQKKVLAEIKTLTDAQAGIEYDLLDMKRRYEDDWKSL